MAARNTFEVRKGDFTHADCVDFLGQVRGECCLRGQHFAITPIVFYFKPTYLAPQCSCFNKIIL
jgi:hypothetical protein